MKRQMVDRVLGSSLSSWLSTHCFCRPGSCQRSLQCILTIPFISPDLHHAHCKGHECHLSKSSVPDTIVDELTGRPRRLISHRVFPGSWTYHLDQCKSHLTTPPLTFSALQLAHVAVIAPKGRDAIYRLFDRNMSSMYAHTSSISKLTPRSSGTSMSHEEKSKRAELFDPLTRYLLLLRPSSSSPGTDTVPMPGALPRSDRKGKSKASIDFEEEDLVGYCSFRFDTEETLGDRDAEVIYW